MLQGIYENPKLITSPVIDAINDTTFFYRYIHNISNFDFMNFNFTKFIFSLDLLKKIFMD